MYGVPIGCAIMRVPVALKRINAWCDGHIHNPALREAEDWFGFETNPGYIVRPL